MPTSTASIGYGTQFAISIDSGTTYTNLANVTSITPPSKSADIIDVTHMESPDQTREFLGGMINPGECSLEIDFDPSSATDVLLTGLDPQLKYPCRITFRNGTVWDFTGFLTAYEPEIPVDDKMTATVTFKITAPVVPTAP